MKSTSVLFAVYVMLLSGLPCNDGYACTDEGQNSAFTTGSHNNGEQEPDNCSPFCVCTCCAAHIPLTLLSSIELTSPVHNTELITFYLEHPMPATSSPIWQPPKLHLITD